MTAEQRARIVGAIEDHARRHAGADPVKRFCRQQEREKGMRVHVQYAIPGGGRRGEWVEVPDKEQKPMPDRKALWKAYWQEAQALGLEVAPINFDAPDEEILRRGRALRRLVIEARGDREEGTL